ncbi:acyl-CoA dehydrogenase [Antricoccus suffuscus]|uniref:Medium-chain specific acyl-CoA dehydrogenase, mitochondrial n=1 Tax=Antricoccus suffuscus TaxID=1629062 RepID=A0A2T1A6P5_9ACTN|nr:acyl-CoA dehydrogenase family protein [Antricoccus suffuscus]PRZ44282.1 acyl-CoA dehydrogenase [Antricoccus suffuscus]
MSSSPTSDLIPDYLADLVSGLDGFVRKEVIGRHETHRALLEDPRQHYDNDGRLVPEVVQIIRDIRMASAEAGYFNLAVPTHLGGSGLGHLAYYLAWKRVYELCPPGNWLAQFAISHWAFGPSIALEGITDEVKERVWPNLISGEQILCFGMSEPGAGSDAMAMTTRATPSGDGWALNGRKIWTTHVPIADWMVVFAVTDPDAQAARKGGISAFLVPMDSPGLELHSIIKMWGEIGGNEGETVFEDVRLEPWQLIGTQHRGFRAAMQGVSLGRIYNSARAVATGTWALQTALDYGAQRETFGEPLLDRQAIGHPLAEASARLHAAHLVALNTARLLDEGRPARKELPMMKYLAIEAANYAVDRAIQTHGAIGFSNELHLVEALSTFRALRVADGTDEILLRTILASLRSGDVEL